MFVSLLVVFLISWTLAEVCSFWIIIFICAGLSRHLHKGFLLISQPVSSLKEFRLLKRFNCRISALHPLKQKSLRLFWERSIRTVLSCLWSCFISCRYIDFNFPFVCLIRDLFLILLISWILGFEPSSCCMVPLDLILFLF